MLHINPVEWLRFGYFLLSDQAMVLGPTYFDLIEFYESLFGKIGFCLVTVLWVIIAAIS